MSSREAQLNETFVALADTLVRGFDLTDLFYALTTACVDLLGADAAGILLASDDGPMRVVGSSDEQARLLELFEIQNDEGPCTDCYSTGVPVSEPDLASTSRWPGFTPYAVLAGFRGVDALPLRLRDEVIGALNLFRRSPGVMTEPDLAAARALADVATIGLVQSRVLQESQLIAEQLQTALRSRVAIEQAKGMLAEQGRTSVALAFEAMRGYARREQRGIDDVARAVIDGDVDFAALL